MIQNHKLKLKQLKQLKRTSKKLENISQNILSF